MKILLLSIITILISGVASNECAGALEMTNATTPSPPQSNAPITITGQYGEFTFEKNCDIKEDFAIMGTIRMPMSNSPVQIRIYNPDGTIYDSEMMPPQNISSGGNYRYLFSLIYDNQTATGTYNVTVSYNGKSAQTSVHLVSPSIIRSSQDNNLRVVDNRGQTLSQINVGQQVQIMDTLQPECVVSKFVYIVQIADKDQRTVALSWLTSSFELNQSMNFSQSWTPFAPGNYTINRFVWQSLTNPNALLPFAGKTVEVR
ncbi:MAG: hypothetical protein ACREBI_07880 [Nitrosotalea sp.]